VYFVSVAGAQQFVSHQGAADLGSKSKP